MSVASLNSLAPDRRHSERLNFRCRARIRVGKREYAGFVEDISKGGARSERLVRSAGPDQSVSLYRTCLQSEGTFAGWNRRSEASASV